MLGSQGTPATTIRTQDGYGRHNIVIIISIIVIISIINEQINEEEHDNNRTNPRAVHRSGLTR